LLKPGLMQTFDPRPDAKTSSLLAPPGSSLTSGGLNDFALGIATMAQPSTTARQPRENPYLESLKPEPAGNSLAALKAVTLPPPRVQSVSSTVVSPPTSTPPQTKIPEFAKPAADDKYFKQLKRF
jgi:hypothetical protein